MDGRAQRIHRVRSLFGSAYLIEDDGLFLVDCGFVGHGRTVARKIRSLGRRLDELKLVLVSHAHLDHFGGLAELADVGRFDIGCHPLAAEALATGGKHVSPARRAWSAAVETLAKASLPLLTFRGATPTMRLEDGEDLHGIGLRGRVLHTPGHTTGCITILLDDGTALIGDLALGRYHGTLATPAEPAMAVDPAAALSSWRKLLEAGAKRMLPAHGCGFTAAELLGTMRRVGATPPRA